MLIATLARHGASERGLVVPVRTSKWLGAIIGQLVFGAAMVTVGVLSSGVGAADPSLPAQIVGFGLGSFFLVLGCVSVAGLRSGAPRLALLESGAAMLGGIGASFVPWPAVEAVGIAEMPGRSAQRLVGLRVRDPEQIQRPRMARALLVGNRRRTGWDLTYAEAMFDVGADELAALLELLRRRPQARRVPASLPEGPVSFEQLMAALPDDARNPTSP